MYDLRHAVHLSIINLIKASIIFLYWLPATTRCLWREARGGFFIFRDEPDELLRFLHSYLFTLEGEYGDPLYEFYQQVLEEMRARRRLKALRESLRELGH